MKRCLFQTDGCPGNTKDPILKCVLRAIPQPFLLSDKRISACILLLLAALLVLATTLSAEGSVHRGHPQKTLQKFIWLDLGEQQRQRDDVITQRYHIHSHPTGLIASQCDTVQIVYWPGDRSGPSDRAYELAMQCNGEDCFVDLRCEGFIYLVLAVRAECEGDILIAQTVHSLYAKGASSTARPEGAILENFVLLPSLSLRQESAHYYLQTGETYHLHYARPLKYAAGGGKSAPREALLLSPDGAVLGQACALSAQSDCVYIPAHDRDLDRSGSKPTKAAILLVRDLVQGQPYTTTLTMHLHRSRYAHLHLPAGLTLFGLTALLILGIVLWQQKQQRRRLQRTRALQGTSTLPHPSALPGILKKSRRR